MTNLHEEPGHGNSVAAWTAVIVAMIGVSAATLGWVLQSNLLLILGFAITAIGGVLGPVLAKLGFGVSAKSHK